MNKNPDSQPLADSDSLNEILDKLIDSAKCRGSESHSRGLEPMKAAAPWVKAPVLGAVSFLAGKKELDKEISTYKAEILALFAAVSPSNTLSNTTPYLKEQPWTAEAPSIPGRYKMEIEVIVYSNPVLGDNSQLAITRVDKSNGVFGPIRWFSDCRFQGPLKPGE